MQVKFAADDFYAALDAQRDAKKLTWKKVAEQAEVSASTFTRIAQGRKPDVDTLTALCGWSGLSADDFMGKKGELRVKPEALTEIAVCLRSDPKLSKEGAKAIEVMVKAAYEQFRIKE